MPEGPEIFNETRKIKNKLRNCSLKKIVVVNPKKSSIENNIQTLKNLELLSVESKGKKTVLNLGEYSVLISYGLTGEMIHEDYYYGDLEKNVILMLVFECESRVTNYYFHDPIGYGKILIDRSEIIEDEIDRLGFDPIQEDISFEEFDKILSLKRRSIVTNVLMDQKIIAGIGNKWVAEILFASRIYPLSKISDIPEEYRRSLLNNIMSILRKATFKNYPLNVYQKKFFGQYMVKIVKNGGRSLYYVPEMQNQHY